MSKLPERIARGMGHRYHASNSHIHAIQDALKEFSRCKVCGKWFIPFKDIGSDLNCCSRKCKARAHREDLFDEDDEL